MTTHAAPPLRQVGNKPGRPSASRPPTVTPRVREVLSFYSGENPGVLTNLARILSHGTLAGTGRIVCLPVDQGFEHGPARSFAVNPDAYDPQYHFTLAVAAGCSIHAAPLGALEAGAAAFAGSIPLVLKVNSHDVLAPDAADPCPSVTGSVEDALRIGAVAIGFTIYPGSAHFKSMYEDLRELTREAKAKGLAVVVWSYARGTGISQKGQTALDVAAYAAHIACQMGAHIIKVKVPDDYIEQDEARKVYEREQIRTAEIADRVRHVIQAAFNGRRIVIFSGGAKGADEKVFAECRAIREGGGFGSIIGRNSFQRRWDEALEFLASVMHIYSE